MQLTPQILSTGARPQLPPAQATSDHDYAIAGRILRVATSGELATQLTTAFMASCCVATVDAVNVRVDSMVRVRSDRSAPPVAGDGQVTPLGLGHWRVTATDSYFEIGDSRVRVPLSLSAPVDVWLGASRLSRHRQSLLYVMGHALHAALRRSGLFGIHGAGMALPGESTGVLIAGPSGAGKSTIALRLAQSGWHYCSDDSLLLYATPRGVTACGLRRPFAVDDRTVSALDWPGLRASLGPPVMSDPHKHWLYPDRLSPSGAATSMRPVTLAFPKLTGERCSRLIAMRAADALSRLIATSPWARGYDAEQAGDCLRVLGRLVAQVRCYMLMAGTDILEAPGRASDLLTQER